MCSFQKTGEFGGRKKGDVARSPPPDDHGFLLVHHLIQNAGQIFTEPGVRRFTRHEAPNWYCTVFLYGKRGSEDSLDSLRHQVYPRRPTVLSQADFPFLIWTGSSHNRRHYVRLNWCRLGS